MHKSSKEKQDPVKVLKAKTGPASLLNPKESDAFPEPQLSGFTQSEWKMPDVRSLSLREAMYKLKSLDLNIEYQGVGQVLKQTPKPSSMVNKGTACKLYLGEKS